MGCRGIVILLGVTGCITVDGSKTDTGAGPPGTTTEPTTTTTTEPPPEPTEYDGDGDGYTGAEDCDDENPDIYPGAVEACDGIDNDCDLGVDDVLAATVQGGESYATVDEAVAAVSVEGTTTYGEPPYVEGVIAICPGTWTTAPIAYGGGSLTLRGVAGRDETTLSALDGATLVSVDEGAALVIEGLTMSGSDGAAISVRGDSALTLTASRLTANGQGLDVFGEDARGGDVQGAIVALTDVELVSNLGELDGGGASLQGTFDAAFTGVTIADNAGGHGGGLYLKTWFGPVSLALTDVVVEGNVASGDGGGVYTHLVPFGGDDTVQIVGNSAAERGGGVASLRALVSNLLISGNHAASGGGLAALYDPFVSTAPDPGELDAVVIDANSADEGGGIWIDQNELVTLRSTCKVTLNAAAVQGGGAMLDGPDSYLVSDFADFGTDGIDDNTPDDVYVWPHGAATFGDDAVFECSSLAFCD